MNKFKIPTIIMIFLILVLLYARFIGSKGLVTKEYTINNSNLPESFNGLKIVHFSDLHYSKFINSKTVTKIVKEINLLNPDIVVFTGDLFQTPGEVSNENKKKLTTILKSINAKYGKYAVLGNHDYDYDEDEVSKILKDSDFNILKNNYDIIHNSNNDKIYLGGLDDSLLGNPNLNQTLKYFDNSENIFSIMLVHEPDYTTNILNKKEPDLILSGHSHNGQVRLPIIGALYTPNGSKKYYKNHYTINNTNLYISSGIGNSKVNIRLFNKPSINFYRINNK